MECDSRFVIPVALSRSGYLQDGWRWNARRMEGTGGNRLRKVEAGWDYRVGSDTSWHVGGRKARTSGGSQLLLQCLEFAKS